MKKNAKILIILAALLAVIIAAALILPNVFSADTQDGQKTITFTVVYDGNEDAHRIVTDAEYLGEAVFAEGLVTEDEYAAGFYTVIDGITADYNADGAWWCITEDGEMAMVGMNEMPIEDGDKFEATYMVG